jgi:Domain of unknown function (DUF1707)
MEQAASRGEELLMATDDSIRASDVDREAVVTTLREAYTAGRLALDEFDERMTAAYASKTWGDLRALTADLPIQPVLGTDLPDDRQPSPAVSLASQPLRPEPEQSEEPRPPVGTPPRRSPVAILIPVAVWTLLVVHGSVGPGVVFLFIAVFALVSIMASIRRR